MKPVVVDASIIGGVLLADEWTAQVPEVITAMGNAEIKAPAHWLVETTNLFTVALRRGRIEAKDRDRLVEATLALKVEMEEPVTEARLIAIIGLADRARLTVYDAAYLELAERTGAALATNDKALIRAAEARGIATISTSL